MYLCISHILKKGFYYPQKLKHGEYLNAKMYINIELTVISQRLEIMHAEQTLISNSDETDRLFKIQNSSICIRHLVKKIAYENGRSMSSERLIKFQQENNKQKTYVFRLKRISDEMNQFEILRDLLELRTGR